MKTKGRRSVVGRARWPGRQDVPNAKRRREREVGEAAGRAGPEQVRQRLMVGRARRRGGRRGVCQVGAPEAVAEGREGRGGA